MNALTAPQVALRRDEINRFILQYRAALPLLENGLRGGTFGEISTRNQSIVKSASVIRGYCDFIREHGLVSPRPLDGFPTLRQYVPKSEPAHA